MNLMLMDGENLLGTQMAGTSVSFSPEYATSEPHWGLLRQLADASEGGVFFSSLETANPFASNRIKTFQPNDLWEWFLKLAILLFPLDVGLRRVQLDRDDLARAYHRTITWLCFWRQKQSAPKRDESLSALLQRRDAIRARQSRPAPETEILEKPPTTTRLNSTGTTTSVFQKAKPEKTPQPAAEESPPEDKHEEIESTTSRLLAAKRKAQRKQ